jgi:flagellar basal-body rod protein FlgB
MINTNIYNYINVLDKAADAANSRNEIISNNIANVDTPNYKRKDVSFQSYLEQALIGGEPLDERVSEINTHLSDFGGLIYTDSSTLSYRLDGNNVDIDTESAMLAENQIRYNALVEQIGQEFARYKTVLSS